MKITRQQLRRLIKESIDDLSPGYPSGLDSFAYITAGHWDETELRQEYKEEIKSAFDMPDKEYLTNRWPAVDVNTLPFMIDEDEFIRKAKLSSIINLPISAMKNIHNHGQVHSIITDYELGMTSKEVQDKNFKFFSQHVTDADASGKTYDKGSSYMRWVSIFADDVFSFNKPPILLHANGKLMHVGGQTRQTGALTNRKILPYLVLDADS